MTAPDGDARKTWRVRSTVDDVARRLLIAFDVQLCVQRDGRSGTIGAVARVPSASADMLVISANDKLFSLLCVCVSVSTQSHWFEWAE